MPFENKEHACSVLANTMFTQSSFVLRAVCVGVQAKVLSTIKEREKNVFDLYGVKQRVLSFTI